MASSIINEQDLRAFLAASEDEINQITNISNFEKYDDPTNFEVCNELVQLIKSELNKECDAYVIGPRRMGLSEGKAEIAVFLDIGQHRFFSERNYKTNIQEIKMLEKLLRKQPKWRILRLNHALPSLNVIYRPTNQRCDLSVTNGFSVQISEMIGHFFEIQPEAVKFYHFIRIWLRINKITFKAFTLTLLVMNYLQECNLMPTAFKAQKNVPQSFIEGIPVTFDSARDICSYSVKKMPFYYVHIRGFFRYYASFNFAENVISTYYGYPVQKEEYQPRLDYDSPMCVAAFLNQKCNISRYTLNSLDQINLF
ncbi:terminal uridylyltransferase Tailor-like [Chironomus tepperi]|uniref:terminal uridylyltransferase Tailor-like n=1 Tax=Chironomus tepperi TaxID=113505 RepID=UPI00391F88A6